MICDNCGKKGAKIRKLPRSYGKGRKLLIVENVPVISCPHCGESYLTAETLHEIERIKLHRNNFAEERPVPIANFVQDYMNLDGHRLTKAWRQTPKVVPIFKCIGLHLF